MLWHVGSIRITRDPKNITNHWGIQEVFVIC
jgi:hypothetical protein